MARTVSLPCAAAAYMLAQGRAVPTGVHIPVQPEFYLPILAELEQLDIVCREQVEPLDSL